MSARGHVVFSLRGHSIEGLLGAASEVAIELRCPIETELGGITGMPLRVAVRLDRPGESWSIVRGYVSEERDATHSLVVAIDEPSRAVAAVLVSRCAHHPHQIMIVDSDLARRAVTRRVFVERGCDVIEAATPLEAMHHLDRSRVDVIDVAQTSPLRTGDELRAYLEVTHPASRIVRVSDGPGSSSYVTNDLRARVSSCLADLAR